MFAPFSFMGESGVIPTPPSYVTKSIVTDSLMMYVDANESLSYGGSGAVWNDLSTYYTASTAKNLSLDASPTFVAASGGTPAHFDFTDGTDAATYKPGGTLDSVTTQGTNYTVCMFFAYHNSTGNYRTIIRTVNGSSASNFGLIVNTGTNNLGIYDGSFRDFGVDIDTDIPSYTTQFNYQVVTNNGSSTLTSFFLNAASGSAEGTTAHVTGQDGPGVFGNQETGGQPGAKIAAILVYDKVLSTAEIGQNYEALKDDMGL